MCAWYRVVGSASGALHHGIDLNAMHAHCTVVLQGCVQIDARC